MTRDMDTTLVTEKNKLTSTTPWIWLFECRVNADDAIRVAKYTADVAWPTSSPNTYDAFNVAFDFIGESGDGKSRLTTLTIANADLQLLEYVRANTGLVGKRVMVRLVHSAHLDQASVPEWLFDVADCSVDRESISWTLGAIEGYELKIPYNQYNRAACRFQFGTAESPCPYLKTAVGAKYSTCEKTWEACEIRGADQTRIGVQKTLPRMAGLFRSIPRPRQ